MRNANLYQIGTPLKKEYDTDGRPDSQKSNGQVFSKYEKIQHLERKRMPEGLKKKKILP